MTILLTGGAGYIGSQLGCQLAEAGEPFVVLDDLSTGSRAMVPDEACFIEGDVRDRPLVQKILSDHDISEVVHFAGSISTTESVENPPLYYSNNTAATALLVEECAAAGVSRFVFSSTAAVYGDPDREAVDEGHPTRPATPYGHSKLLAEEIVRGSADAIGMAYVILRYFNVAGADAAGRTGQTNPASAHLIINALRAAKGERSSFQVFGDDYDTADGTGVRDFIHVMDLADAHLKALDHLREGGRGGVFNCGYGHGFSVLEVIDMVKAVTGLDFPVEFAARRSGDIGAIVADSRLAREHLNWTPRRDDLRAMISDAWSWETRGQT